MAYNKRVISHFCRGGKIGTSFSLFCSNYHNYLIINQNIANSYPAFLNFHFPISLIFPNLCSFYVPTMSYSTITLYKENNNKEKYIIIYYQHNGQALRHRTGITVNPKNWDKKASIVKSTDASFESKNELIKQSHALAEQIIDEFISENGIKPTSQFVKGEIQSGRKLKREKLGANIIDCYTDFLNEKRIQMSSPERSLASLKDYTSLKNALLDYTEVIGNITPNSLNNQLWLDQFNTFLSRPRPLIKGYTFKSSAQNDKTRGKRFSVLRTFAEWLVTNGYITNIDAISKYRIKIQSKNYYALNLNELKAIQAHIFKVSPHQRAIDMFIVACHTGVRHSDAVRIKKSRIYNHSGINILKLNNQKTKEKIEVPLTKKVMDILEKYNYNVNLMTGQKANFYLHEALNEIDSLQKEFEYGVEGDTKPKHQLITFHTGRRTFITNLVNNNVSLNAIMKMTGHKKISTLQKYINSDYELMIDNVKIFNEL